MSPSLGIKAVISSVAAATMNLNLDKTVTVKLILGHEFGSEGGPEPRSQGTDDEAEPRFK